MKITVDLEDIFIKYIDLLAEHDQELIKLTNVYGVSIKFEVSIGGEIPALKLLIESLKGKTNIDEKDIGYSKKLN